MLKILHLADVHLDTVFGSRSERVRQRLRENIRDAFVQAIDIAIGDRVDAVVIAGDLFDGELLSFTTEKLILDQVQRLADAHIPGFYATGNHDPASMRTRLASSEWPDGFHVFRSGTPERVDIRAASGELRGVIVGAGHETNRVSENLAAGFPPAGGEVPHVGLLHTMVTSAASEQLHDRYAPCDVQDLRRTGYDYWALGHVHTRQQVDEEANAWYSGNVGGRNPRETGPRGALMAHVERGKPAVTEFVSLASVEWRHVVVGDLGGVEDASVLESTVRAQLENTRGESSARDWILILDLEGPCPMEPDLRDPDRKLELEEILAESLPALAVELRTPRLLTPYDADSYRGQPHLLGETLALLAELRESEDLLPQTAPEPLAHRSGQGEGRAAYLKSLLEGLDHELVRRLLVEAGR